ncbi:MAG: hypothetical protein EOO68_01400 [Moraxellaceae bacterium]|nr:MAG: hypothetical protein EOO68_01400 [Moraxellaceae bacterium]
MLALETYRKKAKGLPDILNYAALVDSGVVMNKDGSIMVGYFYRGDDIGSATNDERNYITNRVNAALSRFGNGWVSWHDAARIADNYYPESERNHFPDPISKLIDDHRRQGFQQEGGHYVTEYVMVISYMPPLRVSSKVNDLIWRDDANMPKKSVQDQILDYFYKHLATFEDLIGGTIALQRMKGYTVTDQFGREHLRDELVNYLMYCLTGRFIELNIPPYGAYMDTYLGGHVLVTGDTPKIGNNYICPVAIEGYPPESYPNILAVLEALPLSYRWSSRMIYLDQHEALSELNKVKRKWKQKVRGFFAQTFKTQNAQINEDALLMSVDANNAITEASSGLVTFGYFTSIVVIQGENLEEVHEQSRFVVREIQRLGFTCRTETINSLEAWLGTLPGHAMPNIRRPLIHTLNQSDLLPLSNIWAGRTECPCPYYPPHSPPLMYGSTNGATPFRINLHVDDLGHTLIFGPTGAGKSVLLNTLAVQFLRYKDAQIFAFDKGNSAWAASLACGGKHYDIGGEENVLSFAPLSAIDTDVDLNWAIEWIGTCYHLQTNQTLTPKQKSEVTRAMKLLREEKVPGERSITDFLLTVQDEDVRSALKHYSIDGILGSLLDARHDGLITGNEHWTVFEIEHLMEMGEANLLPVLLYLFRRIEKSLNGRPTMLILDEAWLMLGHPAFRAKIREWLKVLRKANCLVCMATQSLTDAVSSGIFDVLIESCPTKILLPNPEADKAGTAEVPGPNDLYTIMGLNSTEINMLKNATRKRDYYFTSAEGKRMFTLGLDSVALNFVAVNYKDNQKLIREFMEVDGQGWPFKWLEHKGINFEIKTN